MTEPDKAMQMLGKLLDCTRDEELDCDDFSENLAAFVEGNTQPEIRALMVHHEKICPECEQERQVLMRALGLDEQ